MGGPHRRRAEPVAERAVHPHGPRRAAHAPGAYNNNYQIVQAPGYVMILVEMLHEPRIIPLDGRPHLPPHVRQLDGKLARALGRRDAGRRDDEFHGQVGVPGIQREHAADRAIHPRGRGHDSTINSRSTIRRRGHGRGRQRCRCRRRSARSSSTPATKGTTACTTPSPAPGPRRRERPRKPRRSRRSRGATP